MSNKPLSARALFGNILAASLLFASPALPQDPSASSQLGERTLTGEVVSSTRNTLTVRAENGQYQLFVFDQDTIKPDNLPVGSRVQVISSPGEEPSVRIATSITIAEGAAKPAPGTGTQPAQPIPADVRRIERNIERQMRRYQGGLRAGIALDPELVLIGAHAQLGPFFNPDVFFRPNVEFAFGEVTTLFALNLEGIYRLPISSRQGRWSSYIGVGPAFTFLHQNFEEDSNDIDFGDFNNDVGLNILGGLRFRTGMFVELKASVYSSPAPTLRLILGYNF